MYSNLIVLICAAFAVASASRASIQLPPKVVSRLEPIIKKCKDETKPPADVFEKLMIGVMEDETSLDFARCYAVEAGYFTTAGRLNVALVTSVVEDSDLKAKFKKVIEDCYKENGNDLKEVIREFMKCYTERTPVNFTV